MFDIIGFKSLREEKGTMGLYQQFSRGILPLIQHSAAGKGKVENVGGTSRYVPDFSGSSISFRIFSDSVLFFTKDDSFASFFQIVHSAHMLLQFGFGGGKAPYRGAIGWGDLIDDSHGILIGSAIEDAYSGESSQAWAGAMLTESCRDFAEKNNYIEQYKSSHFIALREFPSERDQQTIIENMNKLVAYKVPLQRNPKDGPVIYSELQTYAVDWTIRMYEGAAGKSFATTTNSHAQTIAKNTIAFEQWARANNR